MTASVYSEGEVAVAQPVKVEANFSTTIDRRSDNAIRDLVERIEIADHTARAAGLEKANQNGATKLLELVALPKWIPFGLGSSEDHVDTFFQQNYMRADLSPRSDNVLFSR